MHPVVQTQVSILFRNRKKIDYRTAFLSRGAYRGFVALFYAIVPYRVGNGGGKHNGDRSIFEFRFKKPQSFKVIFGIASAVLKVPAVKSVIEQHCLPVSLLFRE